MSETFRRIIEDFDCSHCGAHVIGKGYTDHCPVCLYSQHVDITPGDREAICRGEMEPIAIAPSGSGYVIAYKCTLCGYEYSNKSADDDDVSSFIATQGSAEALDKRLPPL